MIKRNAQNIPYQIREKVTESLKKAEDIKDTNLVDAILLVLDAYQELREMQYHHGIPENKSGHKTMYLRIRAEMLYTLGNWKEAVVCFQDLQKNDPTDISTYINNGKCLFRLNLFSRAIVEFDNGLKIYHEKEQNKDCFVNEDQKEESFNWASYVIDCKKGMFYNWKGLALLNLEKYDEASCCFEEAIHDDSKNPIYYYNHGCNAFLGRNKEKATTSFKKLRELIKSFEFTEISHIDPENFLRDLGKLEIGLESPDNWAWFKKEKEEEEEMMQDFYGKKNQKDEGKASSLPKYLEADDQPRWEDLHNLFEILELINL